MKTNTFVFAISLVSALGGLLFGFDTAVIAGTVDMVKDQYGLTDFEQGMFVSSALVGSIIGVVFAGVFSDRYGRKKALILSAAMFSISAWGCAIAPTHTWLILARLLGGIGVGVASMLSPLYISEVSPPHIRGRLVSLYQLAITLGILTAYFTNAFVLNLAGQANQLQGLAAWMYADEMWRGMFANEMLPALLFLGLLFWIPESPRWLISKGQVEKAKRIMNRLTRGDQLGPEYARIAGSLRQSQSSLKILLQPGLRTALIIGILLPMFGQLSGINAIIYYGPSILKQAGFTLGEAFGGQVTIGIVNVLFTFLAIGLIDKVGRKPLLMAGIAGAMVSLTSIGILFFIGQTEGSLLLFFILFFIASFAFSLGPIPWIIISEIFPTHIRGRAMSIGTFSVWGTNALVGLLFPVLLNLKGFGPSGTFFTFAACCVMAIVFTWKMLPETKGKTLENIQQYWRA